MIHTTDISTQISPVIHALGTEKFEEKALGFLNNGFGTEHYSIFRLRSKRPEFVGGASVLGQHAVRHFYGRHCTWEQASSYLHDARRALSPEGNAVIARPELRSLKDPELRRALDRFEIVDRLLLFGSSGDDTYGISLLRSNQSGPFEDSALKDLVKIAEMFVSLVAKHAEVCWDRAATSPDLDSLDLIEARLREAGWGMSERELQVSARILRGVSALGISLDLGVREDTIATYRKRMYQRLQISGRYELTKKYLSIC